MEQSNIVRKRATALIIEGDKILLIKRIKPGREYFVVPGGGVDEGETIQEALVRETMEEVSLTAEEFTLVGTIENVVMPEGTSVPPGVVQSYYFYNITKYTGTPEIGGPEKAAMNEDNQYHLVWMPIAEVKAMTNLYPQETVRVLADELNKK